MFKSNEEFWQTVNELIAELEKDQNSLAAEELRGGMRTVNGLTDGCAMFLESIEKVKKQHWSQLNSSQKATLKNIHKAVYRRVYCTSAGPLWQIQAYVARIQGRLYKRRRK
jgi:hypothetical protein